METEVENSFKDLSNFVFKRILSDNSQRKLISIEGEFSDKAASAVLILEKKAFTEENVKLLCSEESVLKKEFINDVYGSYEVFPQTELNGIKTTIICPATEEHIKKFERNPVYIIEETKDVYNHITLPFILNRQLSLQWVYNILDHKAESDRIVYEDNHPENGFILTPDLKWDGKQAETLYLLAICHDRSIKSIRDLNDKHLPLLKNILNEGSRAIESKYGLNRSRLRIYFHYPPSFYHLHIHFTFLEFDVPGIFFERAHSLVSVINNIEVKSDYYSESTLLFPVRSSEDLYEKFRDAGLTGEETKSKIQRNDESENIKNDKTD